MLKIVETEEIDEDYQGIYVIEVFQDEEIIKLVSFQDGENEDNNISRNFSDVYKIPDLMRLAYEAGKNGEEMTFEYSGNEDEEEQN